jgi:WD40 repeat protein
VQTSVLLAAESLRRAPSFEADATLRSDLALLPRRVATIPETCLLACPAPALSPDGRWLVSLGQSDPAAHVWSLKSFAQAITLPAKGKVTNALFSLDGRFVAVGSISRGAVFPSHVDVWRTGSWTRVVSLPAGGDLASWSPHGRYLVTTVKRQVWVWDTRTWNTVARLPTGGYAGDVAFSRDGAYMDALSNDGLAYIWSVTSWQRVANLADGYVNDLVWLPNGAELATSGSGDVRIWSIGQWNQLARVVDPIHNAVINSVDFSPDGRFMATALGGGTARVWETATWRLITSITAGDLVTSARFTTNGRYLVTTSYDGTARVWAAGTWSEVARALQGGLVDDATLSPDDRLLAVAARGRGAIPGGIGVCAIAPRWSGARVLAAAREALAVSSDGTLLLTVGAHGARTENLAGGKTVRLASSAGFGVFSFSPDGRLVAGVDSLRVHELMRVWSASTGAVVARMQPLLNENHLAFSPDDRYLAASAGQSGGSGIWSVRDGHLILRLSQEPVYCVGFSPDGRTLAYCPMSAPIQLL